MIQRKCSLQEKTNKMLTEYLCDKVSNTSSAFNGLKLMDMPRGQLVSQKVSEVKLYLSRSAIYNCTHTNVTDNAE